MGEELKLIALPSLPGRDGGEATSFNVNCVKVIKITPCCENKFLAFRNILPTFVLQSNNIIES
jgi:hypothetical protein